MAEYPFRVWGRAGLLLAETVAPTATPVPLFTHTRNAAQGGCESDG